MTTDVSWYDSAYPDTSGDFVLVNLDMYATEEYMPNIFALVEETKGGVDNPATKHWLFMTETPSAWNRPEAPWPERWTNLSHPEGGIPRNVWFGLNCNDKELLSQLPELRHIRARRLFVWFHMGPALLDDAKLDFEAWRCHSCGLRGDSPRPRDCPNHNLCDRNTLDPQIHWAIGKVTGLEKYGIKVWPERPE